MSETRPPTVLLAPVGALAVFKRYWLSVLVLVIALLVFFGWFRLSFYDRGYAPEQPIAYSHKLHAGTLGIDCKYCHFNAERGKHAGIPPSSVCLGCHGPDKGAVNNDKPEIKKLLAMITSEDGSYTDPTTGIIHEGGTVHWKRVHKLPDFVYFSHQWHVKAGVACQTCHGPVEEMTVVRQHATLTMGWCLDCHRKTNYVGGRHYDPKDPSTFTVGTADYDVLRDRIKPDPTADFTDRQTRAHTDPAPVGPDEASRAKDGEHPAAPGPGIERPFGPSGAPQPAQDRALAELIKKHPKLAQTPDWRLADLPETHRAVYAELIAAKLGRPLSEMTSDEELRSLAQLSFQNSPTQCSTCHQ